MSRNRKPQIDKSKPMSTIAPAELMKKKKSLPEDIVFEEILTKVPVWSLLRFGAVSKQWYHLIHNDKRFTVSHFLQSQKNPKFIFSLLNNPRGVVTDDDFSLESRFYEFTTGGGRHGHSLVPFLTLAGFFILENYGELVGYCNGLTNENLCGTSYTILQVSRGDYLHIFLPPISGERILYEHTICHGFGFDSLANEYKLVSVFRTSHKQLNILVFTLGTKSWRDITATSTHVAYRGHPIIWTRASTSSDRSAVVCSAGSECLVWKIMATIGGGEGEIEMLLSFNLHDEKFQFIQLPSISTTDEQQKQQPVAYPHLLEFKGFPCIAILEKKLWNGMSDCYHRRQHDHQGSISSSCCCCCCCCKIHLYLLKGKVKQAWVKEESFDVCVNSPRKLLSGLPQDPCCFCVGSTHTPPARIFSYSDQIVLYWFDGKYLQVYNLRSEKLKVVEPRHAADRDFFENKMKEPLHLSDDSDDNIYCPSMDYQLHCQGEYFLSLQSFVPEGVEELDTAAILELDKRLRPTIYSMCVSQQRLRGILCILILFSIFIY